MKDWANHKLIARWYVKQYVDIETGELIEEEIFNNNYIKTKNDEYTIKYTKRGKLTTRTRTGRLKPKQCTIW